MTDENPNQTERPTSSRRSVLKIGGVGLASLVGLGTVGTSSVTASDDVNTDFNPNNRKEVVGFLNDIDGLTEQKQVQYAKELTRKQKAAIGELYANAKVTFTTKTSSPAFQTSDSYSTKTETTTATGSVIGFGKVYEHTQILSWDYNGSDYKNVSQQLSYELPGPFATFKGKTEETVEKNTNSFTATLSAKYAADVLGVTRGGEATIISKGDVDGNHEVLQKKAPTG